MKDLVALPEIYPVDPYTPLAYSVHYNLQRPRNAYTA